MPRLPVEGQRVTLEYLRSITDEDAERQLRHPEQWSYIVRDPTGVLLAHGRCRTRKACERHAVEQAVMHAGHLWVIHELNHEAMPLDGWCFRIWPPCTKPGYVTDFSAWNLTKPQIEVLLLCTEQKLFRSWSGWFCDDPNAVPDPDRVYSTATISSLWKRGLLEANFIDPRLSLEELKGARTFDGGPNYKVWTNALGREVLKEKGLLVDHSHMLYH